MNFEEECISLLSQLISFETIEAKPEQKHACASWLEQTFFSAEQSLHTDSVSECPYLYKKHPQEHFLFFAHFDVVPGNISQFLLQSDGDTLIGRGVKDMKGALLTFLMAYRDTLREAIDPKVSILLTSDEETAGTTIPFLLESGIVQTKVAYTPDNSKGLVVEHKGVIWADIICKGKGGHASQPLLSTNPVSRLCSVVAELQKKFPVESDPWTLTVTPTMLTGSDAKNKIPDQAICGIDIRFTPEDGSIEEVVQKIANSLPIDCRLKIQQSTNGLKTDSKHPFIQKFKSIAEKVEEKPVELYRENGATDARYFGERGIPAFLYGPVGGGLHANDEWVSVKSLEQQYWIYRKLLQY